MTESAAGWLGTPNLDTVALNPDSFLNNAKSDVANAFSYIEVSDQAYEAAERYLKAARDLVQTADIFSLNKCNHESAKTAYLKALSALRDEVTRCPSSAMAKALGH